MKEEDTKISVYSAAIASKLDDVKQAAVPAIVEMFNPQAVDILIEGLKDSDPDFRQVVTQTLDLLIGQEFETYNQAKEWWSANRGRFDEELVEQNEPE
jgi:HEAT repeat protein